METSASQAFTRQGPIPRVNSGVPPTAPPGEGIMRQVDGHLTAKISQCKARHQKGAQRMQGTGQC